jgi:hypothetical protein
MEESHIGKGMIQSEYYRSNEYILDRVDRTHEFIRRCQLSYDTIKAKRGKSSKKEMELAYFSGKILMYNRQLEKWANHISVKG